ncbi:AraC family transcriptional regulator ligand-binding domain-containing protein [Candidatus Albibeggiatoa sp. nov. NOAA]|uniref:AraC family transcriptional regulator n=1 Tax=Candidatus Albibeggiatoa sp. nov. NOAA TaxID=3162724 RepID=UPI0032FF44F9|nr:AraC family transcriptional regulator [Thiotrichaceae bacterium]
MKQANHFLVQQGWKILFADIGINLNDVLTVAGLPADLFSRHGATLSVEEYFALWNSLEHVAGDDMELPLVIGQNISVEAFDPPIFASFCSPNLNVALQRLQQFKRLIGPLVLHLDITAEATAASVTCYETKNAPVPRSLGTVEPVFFTQLVRLATRKRIEPIKVVLPLKVKKPELYDAYFGIPVEYGEHNQIVFSAQDAVLPFLTENIAMWHYFEPTLKKRLCDMDAKANTCQRVKSVLLELLPSGQSSIEQVASKLAMSKRTMQRRLQQEGISYQFVLNKTRQELAQHYLVNSAMAAGEISFLLGFQDTNSFIRAFNSWTGKTPKQFRNEVTNQF